MPSWESSLRIKLVEAISNSVLDLKSNLDSLIELSTLISSIHYVDGNIRFILKLKFQIHKGSRFPTNEEVVVGIKNLFLEHKNKGEPLPTIVTHGTPRQLLDKKRKWIAEEHKIFQELLTKNGKRTFNRIIMKYNFIFSQDFHTIFTCIMKMKQMKFRAAVS